MTLGVEALVVESEAKGERQGGKNELLTVGLAGSGKQAPPPTRVGQISKGLNVKARG